MKIYSNADVFAYQCRELRTNLSRNAELFVIKDMKTKKKNVKHFNCYLANKIPLNIMKSI